MALRKSMLFDRICKEGLYEDFIDFATFMWWTRRYSFFNSALILLQRPGAVHIETEETWKEKYCRHILPDVTPIVILQPFGPINFVYDFADTYGEMVPDIMRDDFQLPIPDPRVGKFLPALIRTVNQLGIYYGEATFGSRQAGQAEYLEKAMKIKIFEKEKKVELSTHLAITVNKHFNDDRKVTAILHEIGHILCGHLTRDKGNKMLRVPDRSKEELSKEQKEFEAEKVCELICKAMGMAYDNKDYLEGYLINGAEPYFSVRLVIEAADRFMKINSTY